MRASFAVGRSALSIDGAQDRDREMGRTKGIIVASFVGIGGNMLLVAFKLIVGFAANSIAIILDAINNASDALSSLITIVGTKLADRKPDRKHPFGFGRVEYLTSMIIAVIILAAGLVSARESIVKILHPGNTDYTWVTVTVIIVAIFGKIAIGIYLNRAGKRFDSQSLIASAVDSNYDAVISGGTLVAALVAIFWKIDIDGIVGLIISIFVLKAGIDILKDEMNPIIGERESARYCTDIRNYISKFDEVHGVYDLILDDFGPNVMIGSVHIEVDDDMSAGHIHELTRTISEGIYEKYNVMLTIGVYATNKSRIYAPIREYLMGIVKERPDILGVHGFYVDSRKSQVDFDLVIEFKCDSKAIKDAVVTKMKQKFPQYEYNVIVDADYSD